MSTNAFGIDLGTSNIKIYSAADDHIMIEKNMIAIQNKKNIFGIKLVIGHRRPASLRRSAGRHAASFVIYSMIMKLCQRIYKSLQKRLHKNVDGAR